MAVLRDGSCRLERASGDAHPVSGDRARARSRRGRDDMRIPSSGWSAARDTALLSMLLVCLVPLAAFGQPSEDGYLAGYVAAVLERQLNVSPRSLKVKDGVVTIDAADVPRADRPKIMTAITAVKGVTRVEIREGAQPAPSAPVATVPAATSAPATESPAMGFLPTGHLFQSLIADPRWPHFSAAYRYYINTPGPKNVAAVSFGETHPALPRQSRRQGPVGAVGSRAAGRRLLDLQPRLGLLRPHQYRLPRRGLRRVPLRGLLGDRPALSPELSSGRRAAPERHQSQSHQPEL